jgi:sulfite oxidase
LAAGFASMLYSLQHPSAAESKHQDAPTDHTQQQQQQQQQPTNDTSNKSQSEQIVAGQEKPELPFYSLNDVAQHKTSSTGIWVVYKSGVYDITQFVEEHPGGKERIMMAAGSSIEPFWNLYRVHQNANVWEILESHRIGNLNAADRVDAKASIDAPDQGPFAADPPRHPAFLVESAAPFNAEPPRALLADDYVTATELFFTRNHLPVPLIDPNHYELKVDIGAGM